MLASLHSAIQNSTKILLRFYMLQKHLHRSTADEERKLNVLCGWTFTCSRMEQHNVTKRAASFSCRTVQLSRYTVLNKHCVGTYIIYLITFIEGTNGRFIYAKQCNSCFNVSQTSTKTTRLLLNLFGQYVTPYK